MEMDDEKLARYINVLRFEIQGELDILSLKIIKEAYYIALKIEENLTRKQSQRGRR